MSGERRGGCLWRGGCPWLTGGHRTAALKAADQLHSIHHFPLCCTQAVESTWSFLPLDLWEQAERTHYNAGQRGCQTDPGISEEPHSTTVGCPGGAAGQQHPPQDNTSSALDKALHSSSTNSRAARVPRAAAKWDESWILISERLARRAGCTPSTCSAPYSHPGLSSDQNKGSLIRLRG